MQTNVCDRKRIDQQLPGGEAEGWRETWQRCGSDLQQGTDVLAILPVATLSEVPIDASHVVHFRCVRFILRQLFFSKAVKA